ncbi:MAG: prepilin-type cleavage/methylation domain-containing protein [Rhodopirellula sp.]|nr:prepilin-type cleavage/methylation domain-containing protein [Rhodopirellula sp.]
MSRSAGFTLIELVIVIVLLAIVATISVQFVALSTRGALDVSSRQQRALQSVVISEQISREVREAFPLSVRSNGPCLEWLPIVAATRYEQLTTGPDFDEVTISPFGRAINGGLKAIVYGYGSGQSALYDNLDPGPVSPPIDPVSAGDTALSFSGTASHRFRERSPEKRIFVVGDRVSICQNTDRLYRFSGYSHGSGQPDLATLMASGTGAVLGANLEPGSVEFRVLPASLQRAAVVSFTFELVDPQSGETTLVSQEVQVRNVP